MKRLFVLLIGVAIITCSGAQADQRDVYGLDETSETTANEFLLNAFHGTLNYMEDSDWCTSSGKFDGALKFDLNGTANHVKAATKEFIKRISHLGKHILSSGNTMSFSVKGDNLMAMLETAKEFGIYN